MRNAQRIGLLATVLLMGLSTVIFAGQKAPNVTGKWTMEWKEADQARQAELTLSQQAGKLTGSFKGPRGNVFPIEGTIKDGSVYFSFQYKTPKGETVVVEHTGSVSGNSMKGSAQRDKLTWEWTASKAK